MPTMSVQPSQKRPPTRDGVAPDPTLFHIWRVDALNERQLSQSAITYVGWLRSLDGYLFTVGAHAVELHTDTPRCGVDLNFSETIFGEFILHGQVVGWVVRHYR